MARARKPGIVQLSLGIAEQLDELARQRRLRALLGREPDDEQTRLQHKLLEGTGVLRRTAPAREPGRLRTRRPGR